MTARADILTYLTNEGYTPTRAVLAEEGSGDPSEHYTAEVLDDEGTTPTWAVDGTYGTAINFDDGTDYYVLQNNSFVIGSKGTVIIVTQKNDTTNRAESIFSTQQANNATRFSVHTPYSDGTVYFDFGGTGGNNRITTSWTKDTNLHSWAFRAGPGGMSIWRDGTKQSGSHTNAVTRTTATDHYNFNTFFFGSGDKQKLFFWCYIPDEVPDAILSLLTVDRILLGEGADLQRVFAEDLNNWTDVLARQNDHFLNITGESIDNFLDSIDAGGGLSIVVDDVIDTLIDDDGLFSEVGNDYTLFDNPYGIPDQEYYMRRYINDLPDPILEIRREFTDDTLNNWDDAITLVLSGAVITACPGSLVPVSCSTDDFNRADSFVIGGAFIDCLPPGLNNAGMSIYSNQIAGLRPPTGDSNGPPAIMSGNFDPLTTHQSSQLVYRTLEFTDIPTGATTNLNGPAVRMKQVGADLTWGTGVAGYILEYTVTHGTGASPVLSNALLAIWHRGPLGVTQLANEFLPGGPLVAGDVVKFTAANFVVGATTLVCLKGYVNGVLVIQRNNISSSITKITEGRPGVAYANTGSTQRVRIIWDDWRGCIETP